MKKLNYIVLFLFIISYLFYSCSEDVINTIIQTGTITGKVTANGLGLQGASVTTNPATSTIITDTAGNYTISNIAPGNYTVIATKIGYNSDSTTVNVTSAGTAVANIVLTQSSAGLIAYYPFNSNANDESGNNFNGSVNGATLTSDRFNNSNKAYNFNGTNNYIGLPSYNTSVNDFSMSVWVKMTTHNSVGRSYFIDLRGNGTQNYRGLAMLVDATNNGEVHHMINWSQFLCTEFKIQIQNPVGQWVHFVFIRQGSTLITYRNGQTLTIAYAVESCSIAPNANSVPLIDGGRIGTTSDPSGTTNYWCNGVIDDIRIYNRALNNAEVQQLYHEGGW